MARPSSILIPSLPVGPKYMLHLYHYSSSTMNACLPLNHRRKRRRVGAATAAAAIICCASVVHAIHPSAALVAPPTRTNSIYASSRINHAPWRNELLPPLDQLSISSLATISKQQPARNRKKNQLVCYYADEWIDADVKLAFNTGAANPSWSNNNKNSNKSILKRILRRLSRAVYRLKENIRVRIERCTVYVLQCEDGKYYVGSTNNRKRRLREHCRGKGSAWTRTYKPLYLVREYRRIPQSFLLGMESKVTAEAMLKYGVNNVRGAMFCNTREYHLGDIDALTKFLGHYNDLNYRRVNARLRQTLPPSPTQMEKEEEL